MIKSYFDTHYDMRDKLTIEKFKTYNNILFFIEKLNMIINRIYRDPKSLCKPPYIVDQLGVDMYLSTVDDPQVKYFRETYGSDILYFFNTEFRYNKTYTLDLKATHILSFKALTDDKLFLELAVNELFFYKIVA